MNLANNASPKNLWKEGLESLSKKDYKTAFSKFSEAANKGYSNAQLELGNLLFEGKGCAKNTSSAFYWYEKAAKAGNSLALKRLKELSEKGISQAKAIFEKYTKKQTVVSQQKIAPAKVEKKKQEDYQNVNADLSLGENFLRRGKIDLEKAAEVGNERALSELEKLANEQNRKAQRILGDLYFYGNGVPKDISKALDWYTKAAKLGNNRAQRILGDIYCTKKDLDLAGYWYGESAKNGNKKSFDSLVELAKTGDETALVELVELAKSGNEQVLQSLEELAKNRSDIQFDIGEIYYAKDDFDKACDWYKKAAQQNNKEALDKLVKLAQNGNEKALQSLEAVAQNRSDIQFEIGEIYSGKKDIDKACDWYEKAARQYNKEALQRLEDMAQYYSYCGGSNIQFALGEVYCARNAIEKACDWYKKAAQQNNEKALQKLKKLANTGDESALKNLERVPQNSRSDIQFALGEIYCTKGNFEKAAELGNAKALYKLIELAKDGDETALKNLELVPQSSRSDIQFTLGEIYCAKGNFEKAAELGNAKALQKLIELAKDGDETALKSLERLPQISRSDIQFALGEIYASKKDFDKACEWYEKSAQQNNKEALQRLVELAKNDKENALQRLEKLPQTYRSDIQLALGEIYASKKDFDKACDWYEKSARQGNEYALHSLEKLPQSNRSDIQLALGEIYAGKGNIDKACDWYEKSAQQGNKEALQKLAELVKNGQHEITKIHQQQENNKRLYNSNQSSPVRYGRIKGYYVNERLEVCFVDEKMEPSEYKSDSFSPTGIFAQTFRENGKFGSYPLYDSDEEIESDEFDF